MLDNEQIPPDTTKQGPLDMSQYSRLFSVTRVPRPDCDELLVKNNIKYHHILVMVKDQMFIVYVYDVLGNRISRASIQSQFNECIKTVESRSINYHQPPICLLTGQHRDAWSLDYIELSKYEKNCKNFELIQNSLFAVCLDDKIVPNGVSNLARNVFHGFDGHNRWFDKALSIVVTNCGQLGVNGE